MQKQFLPKHQLTRVLCELGSPGSTHVPEYVQSTYCPALLTRMPHLIFSLSVFICIPSIQAKDSAAAWPMLSCATHENNGLYYIDIPEQCAN
mmetsp:Transcript_16345/g.27221  ORF Transcript_16345/g.27221 Transcript_16345/m.27221 type:complete len:92 (-) Transcript_16345:63-338(-)